MDLSTVIVMKVKKGDNELFLGIPFNTPYADIHAALMEMVGNVDFLAKKSQEEKEKREKEEKEKAEEGTAKEEVKQ